MLNKEINLWIIICFLLGAACSYVFSSFIEFKISPVIHPLIINENISHTRKIKKLDFQEILEKNIFNAKVEEKTKKIFITKENSKKLVTEIEGYKLIGFVAGENPVALFKKEKEPVCIVDKKNPLGKKWYLEKIEQGIVFLKNKETGEIKKFNIALLKEIKSGTSLKINYKKNNLSKDRSLSNIEKFKIDKKIIDKELADINKFIKQVGITPFFKDGKAIGYRIVYINRKSILPKIGLQRGDVIVKINGVPTNSPTKLADMFAQLKEAENVTLDILRRGKKKTIFIEIE